MIPVITKVIPVIIPVLCSNLCQFIFSNPLYAYLTNNAIPVIVIRKYIKAINQTNQPSWVPANKKYPSISMQGEKNIATARTIISWILDRFLFKFSFI